MKSIYLLVAFSVFIGCSAPSNQPATASEEDVSLLVKAIEGKEATKAFSLLSELEFSNELKISEEVILFYQEEPNFNSWFVSTSKIENGPSYFYLSELALKDITSEVPGNELLVYAGHTPYTYVDAYAFPVGGDFLAEKIIQSQFNGSGEDGVITISPAPDESDYGITPDFEVALDKYQILSHTQVPTYEEYINWVENNLASFVEEPGAVPSHLAQFVGPNAGEFAPVLQKRGIRGNLDLVVYRSVENYKMKQMGFLMYTYLAAIYKDSELIYFDDFYLNGWEDVSEERVFVSLVEDNVAVLRKAYTESTMGEVIEETFYPDTTYYYSISESGELIAGKSLLPAIAGDYGGWKLSVAINGDLITGYYNNGRYEGNPNFGCSFLFYGDLSDFEKRKMNIQTINPFDLSAESRSGKFKLHSEEDELLSISANLNSDDCWDKSLGFAAIGQEPGTSFELDEAKNYKEIKLITQSTTVYWEPDEVSNYTLSEGEPVIVVEELDDWISIVFFTGNGHTEGLISKGRLRSLSDKS